MVDLSDPTTFVGPDSDAAKSADALSAALANAEARASSLAITTNGLARSMSQAFVGATVGGKQFDDVLKTLALRMSNLVVSAAFRPLASGLSEGLTGLFSGLFSGSAPAAKIAAATGAIKPFAAGGVIGTPTYFPLASGGTGLAGEAGPEAIVPLRRGADGRLGIAAGGGNAGANVTVNISTPDADSFHRSEVYLTGQIARAVARGQRGL
jgi:phage-related minor tail protein